jgi:hypothetical protein
MPVLPIVTNGKYEAGETTLILLLLKSVRRFIELKRGEPYRQHRNRSKSAVFIRSGQYTKNNIKMSNIQNGKVKVKLSPCTPRRQMAEQMYIASHFGARWRRVASFTLPRLAPVGKETTVPTERGMCGPQGRSCYWPKTLKKIIKLWDTKFCKWWVHSSRSFGIWRCVVW